MHLIKQQKVDIIIMHAVNFCRNPDGTAQRKREKVNIVSKAAGCMFKILVPVIIQSWIW